MTRWLRDYRTRLMRHLKTIMEYKGKLYGKVGKEYIETTEDTYDVEKIKTDLKEARERIEDMLKNDDGQAHKEARKFLDKTTV